MRNLKPYSSVLKLTSLLLAVALLCGALMSGVVTADSKGKKDKDSGRVRHSKVSSDLYDKRRGGKGSSETVNVIIQLEGKATGRLNALLSRNGVHVNGQFKNLNMLAVELPVDVVEELASLTEVSYISSDREIISLGGHLSTTTGADAVRAQTTATGTAYTLDGKGIGMLGQELVCRRAAAAVIVIIVQYDNRTRRQAWQNGVETKAHGVVPIAIEMRESDRRSIVGWPSFLE